MRVAYALLSAFILSAGCLSTGSDTTTTTTIPAGSEGGFCGGIAGIECGAGLMCRLEGDWDAGGVCVNPDETGCSEPADCEGMPHIMCAGAWSCKNNKCSWDCEMPKQDPVVVSNE